MEDLQGTLSTKGLRISFTADKGRRLVATRNFFAGDVIIRQDPYASISNFSHDSRCEGCFSSCNLKKCSACRMTWYCGSSCQKSEWILHQQECQALVKLSADRRKMLTPSLRLMIRIFLKKSLQSQQIIPTTAADNYDLVEALMAHMSDIGEQRLLLYAQMSNLVNLILPSLELNIKEITQNFSKLACNAHTICDSELRPLGTGLYPVISIINHSCLPNSVLVFEGREAVVRAVEPIPKDTEVTISYIETAASSETRQKALREQYFFTCKCPQCIKMGFFEDIQENAMLDGYRCKDKKCDGFLVIVPDKQAYVCHQCGLTREHYETENMANELKQLAEKASISLSSGNYSEACVMYKTIEQLQLKLCHSFSISLLQTRETLLKILLELKDWRGALSYCRLTIPVYERVYPPIHPLSGLQYYTCGKLEWLLGDIQDARRSLAVAADILRFTHGIDTPFVKSLLIKLEEASDAAYWLAKDH